MNTLSDRPKCGQNHDSLELQRTEVHFERRFVAKFDQCGENPVVHKRKRRLLAEERKTKPDIVSAQAAVVFAILKAKKSTSIVARTEGSMHGEHAKYGSSGAPLSLRSVRFLLVSGVVRSRPQGSARKILLDRFSLSI